MAPSPPHLGQPGPSTWQLSSPSSHSSVPHLSTFQFERTSRFTPRGPRRSPVFATQSVVDNEGGFNGSCAASEQDGTAIETPMGSCSSYYPDITVYCCSGVQGDQQTLAFEIDTDGGEETSTQEPICRTDRYSDSLACFRLTAESHCRSGNSGIYGVCNPNTTDASTVVAVSGAAATHYGLGGMSTKVDMGWKGKMVLVACAVFWTALGVV